MTTFAFTRLVVRLKFSLVKGGSKFTLVLLGVASAVAVLVTIGAWFGSLALRDHDDRGTLLALGLAVTAILWFMVSVVFSGGEGTLDPRRFTLYPIESYQLGVGLLAAAFVGIPAAMTALVALAVVLQATSATGFVILAVAAMTFTLTCVLLGRIAIAAMTGLLRGRRTRELAGGVAALMGISVGLVGPLLTEYFDFITIARLESVRSVVRWTPIGWTAEAVGRAATGDLDVALLFLLAGIAFVAVLWNGWWSLFGHTLVGSDQSPDSMMDGSLLPTWMRPFGHAPVVAVWARSLRQLRRDPREFLEIAGFLPMIIVFALPSIEALRQGDQRAVLGSASLGVALGITSLNIFGADGRSFGVDALAATSLRDVLVGKVLSRITIAVPLVLALSLTFAALTRGWQYVFPSLAIGLTGLLAMASVGMFVSTRFPFPLPEHLTTGGAGMAGCSTGVLRMVALIIAMTVAAPGVLSTSLIAVFVSASLSHVVGLLSLSYGLVLFWISARTSGRWATLHVPEMFQTLSARS